MVKVLLSLALIIGSFPAYGQVYANQVYGQLQDSYTTLRKFGNIKLEKTIISNVTDDSGDQWTFYMYANRQYFIAGACDSDCSDVDLYITRENSTYRLSEDKKADDKPIISIKPTVSGNYTITLKMYDCRENICYQGFSVYSIVD